MRRMSQSKYSPYTIDVEPNVELVDIRDQIHVDQEEDSLRKISSEAVSFRRDFEEFASYSTIHGLRRFLPDIQYKKIRRPIWMVLILGYFLAVQLGIILTISRFFEYDITTTLKQVYVEEVPFPAVTICNFNKYRLSYTANNTNFSQWLLEVYGLENKYLYQIPPNGELVAGINKTEFMLEAAHQKENMILLCFWKGKKCGPNNFTTVFTDYGVCYTFNGDPENVLTIEESGLESGLFLLFNTETTEYNLGNKNIEGFVTIISNQDEPPSSKQKGNVFTSTGRLSVIGLQKAEFASLSSPYPNKCLSSGTKYQKRYSQSQCLLEKSTSISEELCGCIEPYMPGTARICNFNESYYCVEKLVPDLLKKECKDVPCLNKVFFPQISTAKMPSSSALKEMTALFDIEQELLKENFAGLSIFYSSMRFEFIEEIPSINFESLMAEIGGIMGFGLGTSFLSTYETNEFIFLSIWKQMKKNILNFKNKI